MKRLVLYSSFVYIFPVYILYFCIFFPFVLHVKCVQTCEYICKSNGKSHLKPIYKSFLYVVLEGNREVLVQRGFKVNCINYLERKMLIKL